MQEGLSKAEPEFVVSSAHPATGNAPALSDPEFGPILVSQATLSATGAQLRALAGNDEPAGRAVATL